MTLSAILDIKNLIQRISSFSKETKKGQILTFFEREIYLKHSVNKLELINQTQALINMVCKSNLNYAKI
jgi:hypothetical protein